MKEQLKQWLPPVLLQAVRRCRSRNALVEWEYCADGWTRDPRIQGWNSESIAETQKRLWPGFVRLLEGTGPLGVNHTDFEPTGLDLLAQNNVLAFAYVLALAAGGKERVSLLDWGGGVGHYGAFARALLPGVPVDYVCKDVPALCAAGRELFPEGAFVERESQLAGRRFDLVLCSNALQYSESWQDVVTVLAGATGEYFYLARVPAVRQVPSFVVVQRPYAAGYDTEYLGWFFNRDELLGSVAGEGLELLREFLMADSCEVKNSPEQAEYRGFLFRRAAMKR